MKKTSHRRSTLKARLLDLWKSHGSPREIAGGVAVGVFIGITPLYGFHIMMAVIAALIMRHVNKVAIFLGMNISLPPTIPFITWAGYSIGRRLLGSAYPPLGWDAFRDISSETIYRFIYALSVGSLVLGVVLSGLFYFVTLWIFQNRKTGVAVTAERG